MKKNLRNRRELSRCTIGTFNTVLRPTHVQEITCTFKTRQPPSPQFNLCACKYYYLTSLPFHLNFLFSTLPFTFLNCISLNLHHFTMGIDRCQTPPSPLEQESTTLAKNFMPSPPPPPCANRRMVSLHFSMADEDGTPFLPTDQSLLSSDNSEEWSSPTLKPRSSRFSDDMGIMGISGGSSVRFVPYPPIWERPSSRSNSIVKPIPRRR